MNILALDCHLRSFNLCILYNKKKYYYSSDKRSEYIAPILMDLFDDYKIDSENIDLFCACKGPGSFTGLRAGMSFLSGLTLGDMSKVRLVPTFSAYAHIAENKNINKSEYFCILKSGMRDYFLFLPETGETKLVDKDIIGQIISDKKYYAGDKTDIIDDLGKEHFGSGNLSRALIDIIQVDEQDYTDTNIEYMKRPSINVPKNKGVKQEKK